MLAAITGCGDTRKNRRDPTVPEREVVPDIQPTPVVPVTGTQPPIPLKTPEEECKEKAADYDWVGEKCIEKPNLPLTGSINIVAGTVWTPSSENCTRVYRYNSENKPKTYRRCAGVDITIPLAKPVSGQGINTLKLGYNCDMVLEFPVEIKIGSTNASLSPRNDNEPVFSLDSFIEADSDLAVSFRFIPDYKKVVGAFAVNFPEACRIFIVENSVTTAN